MTIHASFATGRHHDAARLQGLCRELLALLADAKRSVDEEIRTYPTPIPRCDAQFNHLYDERARLAAWLLRLRAAAERDAPPDGIAAALAAFVATPPCTASGTERDLRARLDAALEQWGAPAASPAPASTPGHAARHR